LTCSSENYFLPGFSSARPFQPGFFYWHFTPTLPLFYVVYLNELSLLAMITMGKRTESGHPHHLTFEDRITG